MSCNVDLQPSVMASFRLVLVVLASLALSCVHAQKEARFKSCKRKQPLPKLNECTRDAFQSAVPELANGLPEYNILPLDPLQVEKMVVPRGKGAVSVDLTFSNLDITGFRDVKVPSLEVDVEKMFMKAKLEVIGNVNIVGDYNVNGKVLVLPITGTGRCNITLVNVEMVISEAQARPIKRKGKLYADMTSLVAKVEHIDRAYFQFDNLFNGNKELGDNMNQVVNDNWKEVLDDMVSPVFQAISIAFRNAFHNALIKVPYDSIFTS